MIGFKSILFLMLLLLVKRDVSQSNDDDDYCSGIDETACRNVYYCIWTSTECVLDACNKSCDSDKCKNITVEEMGKVSINAGQTSCPLYSQRQFKSYCISKDRDDINLCDTILLSHIGDNGAVVSDYDLVYQCGCISGDWCKGTLKDFDWSGEEYSTCTVSNPMPVNKNLEAACNEQDVNVSTCETIDCYVKGDKCSSDPCYADNIEWNYGDGTVDKDVVCHPGCAHGSVTLTYEGATDTYDFCYLPTRTIDQCSYYIAKGYECTQNVGSLTVHLSMLMLSFITLVLTVLL